jgi:hypothetical protein
MEWVEVKDYSAREPRPPVYARPLGRAVPYHADADLRERLLVEVSDTHDQNPLLG